MSAVTIFDEVVLPASAADGWLDDWRATYLPAATQRGLHLQGAWRGASEDPDLAVVVIQWTLPTVEAFFVTRGEAAADPTVQAFWAATDRVAIRRDRRVLAGAGVVP